MSFVIHGTTEMTDTIPLSVKERIKLLFGQKLTVSHWLNTENKVGHGEVILSARVGRNSIPGLSVPTDI